MTKKRHIKKPFFIPVEGERLVPSPSNILITDLYGKLPAEKNMVIGSYPDVWRRARQHDLFNVVFNNISFNQQSQDIYVLQLNTAIKNTLSMAHKSGQIALGLDAVLQDIQSNDVGCIIVSRDAGGADKKKLLNNPVSAKYCYEFGNKQELGALFHRRAQVYCSIKYGELAEKCSYFLRCSTRFHTYDAV